MLVDTSVWIDHLRHGNPALEAALREPRVWVHPFVIGELACGHLVRRAEVLRLLDALPHTPRVHQREVMTFLDSHRLMGQGLGWIDIHLLASARLAGIGLWTLDTKLAEAARALDLVATRP